MQKVKCENKDCKKTFVLHVKLGPEIEGKQEVYFKCSFCSTKYHSYYENYQSMSIQRQINELTAAVNDSRIIKKGVDYMTVFNKRQVNIRRIEKLKNDKKTILKKINKKLNND